MQETHKGTLQAKRLEKPSQLGCHAPPQSQAAVVASAFFMAT
jgi:hypothetical protein